MNAPRAANLESGQTSALDTPVSTCSTLLLGNPAYTVCAI